LSRIIVRDSSVARPRPTPSPAARVPARPKGANTEWEPWPPLSLRPSPLDQVSDALGQDGEREETIDPVLSEAETLLHDARLQAAELVQAARQEAEDLRIAARRQGEQEGQEEWEKERSRLGELVAGLGAAYQRFCQDQVPVLADLATLAAEKLLGEQIACEPERVLAIVRTAMEEVVGATQVTLRLNPDDVELVQSQFSTASPGHAPAVQILPDPAVQRGGCWIESEQGKVDATVASRIARLGAAMGAG
jgi:flagellar assembly protein FliH